MKPNEKTPCRLVKRNSFVSFDNYQLTVKLIKLSHAQSIQWLVSLIFQCTIDNDKCSSSWKWVSLGYILSRMRFNRSTLLWAIVIDIVQLLLLLLLLLRFVAAVVWILNLSKMIRFYYSEQVYIQSDRTSKREKIFGYDPYDVYVRLYFSSSNQENPVCLVFLFTIQ